MLAQYQEAYEHSAETLFGVWSDSSFLRFKYAKLGQLSKLIRVVTPLTTEATDTMVLSIYRSPVTPPGLLRRVVPLYVDVQQCDRWRPTAPGGMRGTWQLDVDGLPLTMTGVMSLTPSPEGGALFAVNCQIIAAVPSLLRAPMEKFGASTMRRTLGLGAALTAEWLELHGVEPEVRGGVGEPARSYGGRHSVALAE